MYVALIIFAVVVVIGVLLYNSLIQRRNRVDNAWSQIDVQLKRRLDLIPNLVETVKGYAAHEKTTFDAVISARQAAIAAPSTPAAQSGANANFLALQEELTSTESRVAYARQFYNDEVLGLNNAIQKIPGLFVARLAKIGPRDYFDAEPAADNPPKVQF
ncbi:MAG: LemA family protein [Actinobacteria bacterium]|nr:LemA family protein [Actinomycetota bacterium]